MPLRNPFRRQIEASTSTLRERAAHLRASLRPGLTGPAECYPLLAGPVEDDESDDAELIRVGHLFEGACEREAAACEACNEALREAQRHMPERPAALVFRASDHPLRLRKYLTHPDHLEGEQITAEDVAWMRRKPYVREVLRPVRPEDNLPTDARTVVEAHPWPEAQDRADEIVTAWEAWQAEQIATHSRYVTEALDDAAVEAGEAAAALADRLADLPARTAAGFRVKLRALARYRRDVLDAELADEPDPDHTLSHSLRRDVRGDLPATPVANSLNLVSLIDFTSATMSELLSLRDIAECIGDVAYAHAWGARCRKGTNAWGAFDYNAAGKLVASLGDALTAVESAAEAEAKRRTPGGENERSTRLYMLALTTIDNGDPDEIEAFAREMLDHAAADREGR